MRYYRYAWRFEEPVTYDWLYKHGLTEQLTTHENGFVICFKADHVLTMDEWEAAESKGGYLAAVRIDGPLNFYKEEDGVHYLRIWSVGEDGCEWRWDPNPTFEEILGSVYVERPRCPYLSRYSMWVHKGNELYKQWAHRKAAGLKAGLNRRRGKKPLTELQKFIGLVEIPPLKKGGNRRRAWPRTTKAHEKEAESSPYWAWYSWYRKKPWDEEKWVYRALIDCPLQNPELPRVLQQLGPDLTHRWRKLNVPTKLKTLVLEEGSKFAAVWIQDPNRHVPLGISMRIRDMGNRLTLSQCKRLKTIKGLIRRLEQLEEEEAIRHSLELLKDDPSADEPVGLNGETMEEGGFRFSILRTPREIIMEGAMMHHCVGGYVHSVKAYRTTIWVVEGIENSERATMELTKYGVRQLFGKRNSAVSDEMVSAAKTIAEDIVWPSDKEIQEYIDNS